MDTPEGITELPNGQWVITEDTHLSLWAQQKGHIVTDPNVFKFLKPFLDGADVVWDIGANIGDHTRQYLDWGMEVVAVEPNPLAYACLVHNCKTATCINAAASDIEGEPLKFMRLDNVGASRVHKDGEIEVYPIVLDQANLPAPDFVKIDIEGWELFALQGMQDTIASHRPLVYCEINEGALALNKHKPEDVVKFFEDWGYETDMMYPRNAKKGDPQYDILFFHRD